MRMRCCLGKMAEELNCVLMSTPKYEVNRSKSQGSHQGNKLHWSPDSIVAHGNLTSLSCKHDPGVRITAGSFGYSTYGTARIQWSSLEAKNTRHPLPKEAGRDTYLEPMVISNNNLLTRKVVWPQGHGELADCKHSGDSTGVRFGTGELQLTGQRQEFDRGITDHGNRYLNYPYRHPPWGDGHLTSPFPTSSSPVISRSLHLKQPGKLFGTSSSSAQRERAAELGIPPVCMEASFEGNQSFPKVSRQWKNRPDPTPVDITMNRAAAGPKLEALQGDGLNDISFASSQPRKKYFPRLKDVPPATGSGATSHKSLSESWSFSGFLGNVQTPAAFPSTVRNPNKAICTIAASTSEILTANDMACTLFGYEESELVGRPLKDLLRLKSKDQETIMESHLEPSGQIISLAGKVVEVLDSHGLVLPVSLWVKRLDTTASTTSSPHSLGGGVGGVEPKVPSSVEGSRLLCVMEPVERTVGHVTFDADGEIQWCDDHMAQLCGYAGPHQVSGLHMNQLIPAFHCPDPSRGLTKEVKKQRATGRTRDGMSFPLSIVVRLDDDVQDDSWIPPSQDAAKDWSGRPLYQATVWVFANISGLISLRPDGTIHSLNENFARLLFGYNRCELIGHSISKLIPDFFDLLELESNTLPLPPLHDDAVGEDAQAGDEGASFHGSSDPLAPLGEDLCAQSTPSPAWRSEVEVEAPVTSTPCGKEVEESLGSSDSSSSTSTSSISQKKEIYRIQKSSSGEGREVSPLLGHKVASSAFSSDDSRSPQSPGNDERGEESCQAANTVCLGESKDSVVCAAHASLCTIGEHIRDIDRSSGPGDEGGRENQIFSTNKDMSDWDGDGPVKGVVGQDVNSFTENRNMIGGGEEVDQNNSNRETSSRDRKHNERVLDCEYVRQDAAGGSRGVREDDWVVHHNGNEEWLPARDPLMGLGCHSNVSDMVIGCDDVDVEVVDCDTNPLPPVSDADDDKPAPSPTDEHCTILSPIKALKAHLFNESFVSNSSDDDACGVGDTTADLLVAKVATCDISDLIWSEDEGQGGSSGQGVSADISGNVEDSLNQEREGRRLSLEDGRMSRLSHSDPYTLRSKVISGGLDSSSSTSDEGGPQDDQFLSLLPPSNSPHSFLSASGTGSATYLEDESSYFSHDGASLSNACTESSGSQASSGCLKGLSDHSIKDSAEECATTFRDTQTEVCGNDGGSHTRVEASTSPDLRSTGRSPPQGQIPEGSFSGQGRHKDGGTLGIVFQIRRVMLTDGSEMLLLWLSRDPEDVCEASRSHGNLTLASSFSSTLDQSQHSLGELLQEQANSESKLEDIQEAEPHNTPTPQPLTKMQSASNNSDKDEDQHEVSLASMGEFSEHYTALSSIGKGAFGFVKLGCRRRDSQEVVVKFIRRAKVLRESWVKDSTLGVIPMEVFLLLRLNHPNIVKVMDVYQNADFIQLVMERHGGGMDLFEFIDRNPRMDEPLTSYIFRQMVSGVSYLHSENVVHRDIKDENIIIDEHFHIKLIDFGAATYMLPGRLFATFCGTIEYCSPEVLKGNKYRGPELEMWSLGITLYTLIFGENPFFDVEETLQGVLKPPNSVSRALMFLITWLLHPDPLCRATITDVERNAWVNQTVDMSRYQWDKVLPNTEFYGNTACDNREDTSEHSVVSCRNAVDANANAEGSCRQDSPDSFSCCDTKDCSPISSANNSVHHHGSTNSSAHSSADSSGGHGDTTTEHSSYDFGSSERHNRRKYHSGRSDRIMDVTSDFNRLLHLHGRLDSDY